MYCFSKPKIGPVGRADAGDAEATCTGLGLTYRVKQLCTGDIGFAPP